MPIRHLGEIHAFYRLVRGLRIDLLTPSSDDLGASEALQPEDLA